MMYMGTPRLEIYVDRIETNARAVIGLCRAHGIQVACVTKVMSAHPAVLRALESAGADMIADSRIPNLQSIANIGSKLPTMLLRSATPSRVVDVVRCADYSLNSSAETMELLSRAARLVNRVHKVIVMVDLGDLREGIWPDRVASVIRDSLSLRGIEIVGLGANLACYGGVIPTTENMQMLVDIRDACRKATGLPLDLISGGNSSNLPLLVSGGMPPEINHLRIGEAITLGRNVTRPQPWPGTRQDTVRVVAEVVEVERKPSIPIGVRGQDAFGEEAEVRRSGHPPARHLQHRPPGRGRGRHHAGGPGHHRAGRQQRPPGAGCGRSGTCGADRGRDRLLPDLWLAAGGDDVAVHAESGDEGVEI